LDQSDHDPLDEKARESLDPGFIKACDALVNFEIPHSETWSPDTMQVVLRRTKEQDNAIAWPAGWIEQARYGGKLFACVKMATGAEDITNRILSAELRVRRSSSSTIVSSNDGVRWKVLGVKYILPGRIIYSERLADDVSGSTLIASGPCKL
jgi:hypothetical protein